uniref:Uncharacterized protein n=1 Tax=Knipowitschia caucasica TaxID=637954 RepID=A0AAV2IX54_KNICA
MGGGWLYPGGDGDGGGAWCARGGWWGRGRGLPGGLDGRVGGLVLQGGVVYALDPQGGMFGWGSLISRGWLVGVGRSPRGRVGIAWSPMGVLGWVGCLFSMG